MLVPAFQVASQCPQSVNRIAKHSICLAVIELANHLIEKTKHHQGLAIKPNHNPQVPCSNQGCATKNSVGKLSA